MKKIRENINRLLVGMVSLSAILIILNSCEGSNTEPGLNEVFIRDMAFNPQTITVPVNTTITWTNKDAIVHTATSNTGVFDSGSMGGNATFSYTFTSTGTYPYHCTPHPAMTATVIVN